MLSNSSFAALLYLASSALAQNLSFVRPQFKDLDTNGEGLPQLPAGESVNIAWSSEFEYTTLTVYQEAGTDFFWMGVLAESARRDKTEVQWIVDRLPGSDGVAGSYHFELRNSLDGECEGCSLNSKNFVVSRMEDTSSRTTSSSATSVVATSTQSVAASSSSTSTSSPAAAIAGAQSTASSDAVQESSGGSSDSLRIGLGVGLGLGIPLLLALMVALFFFGRKRKRRNSLPRGRQPSPSNSPNRASGAWLYQDGRQSQQSMIFQPSSTARPSTTARSEMSSWSHRSWIEPFDFEQMEMRDQDAISQLRQSIYSNSARSNAASEWGGLEGILEQPQEVHDGRWSRTL